MIPLSAGTKELADFKDPFKSKCVKAVHFHCYAQSTFTRERYTASIEFQNGKTQGAQNFDAQGFGSLVQKVQDFIEGLEE